MYKKNGFICFPKASLHPLIFKYIKLFSFEAYPIILLVDFSLLQLLTGLTLSDLHLSITLHVVREILHHLFHLCKNMHLFFFKICRFLLQSSCNTLMLCCQVFKSDDGDRERRWILRCRMQHIARGQIGATAAGLQHRYNSTRSKLCLQPTPQRMSTLDL